MIPVEQKKEREIAQSRGIHRIHKERRVSVNTAQEGGCIGWKAVESRISGLFKQ